MNNNSVNAATQNPIQKASKYRYLIALILMFTIGVSYADRVSISVLIANPDFMSAMGITGQAVQKGMLMSVFLIAYGLANVFLGSLGDVFGPRKVMCMAIILWAVSMILGGLANVFAFMLLARVLLGVGEGMQYPLMGTYVKNWFPQQERGRANACWTIGMTLAPAIALPFFGWLIITFGWRYNFFFCALLSMVPLYLILTHTTDVPSQNQHVNKEELEYIQAGMEEDTIQADVAAKEPYLTRLKKFSHNYRFWMMVVWYMGIQIILWGLVTWLPSYLKMGRGFSWTEMGFLASMPFVLGIFVKAATGWAIDVVHKSGIFCLLATVGAALGLYFSATIENNWISAVLIICSQGFMYMGSPASFTLLQKLVPAGSMATATGLMIGLSMFAGAVSPMLIGYFINFTGSYSGGIFFLGIAAVISTVAMLPLAKQ